MTALHLPTIPEAPRFDAADEVHLNRIRGEISVNENKLSDTRGNIEMSDEAIKQIEKSLEGWKKFRSHQQRREAMFEKRIQADREQLRLEEDYASGVA